jgi:hypothetical protein
MCETFMVVCEKNQVSVNYPWHRSVKMYVFTLSFQTIFIFHLTPNRLWCKITVQ